MSLQGLMSGSECALPNNPLAQVLKHTESDHSIQRDRIAGPSSSRLQHLPSSSTSHASANDISMARQFFDPNAPASAQPGIAAQMRSNPLLSADMAQRLNATATGPASQASLNDLWMNMDMQNRAHAMSMQQMQGHDSAWAAEFGNAMARMQPNVGGSSSHSEVGPVQNFMQSPYSQSLFQPSFGTSPGMFGLGFPQTFNPIQVEGKGKGKSREEAFEAAFEQFANFQPQSSAKIEEINDVSEIEKAMNGTSLEEGKVEEPLTNEDFKKAWEQLRNSELPPPEGDLKKWEAEFNQLMQSQRDELDYDYGDEMKEIWENGMGAYDGSNIASPPALKFSDEGIPELGQYEFDVNNRYLSGPPSGSSLEEAKNLLLNNGSLTEAALLLEAAIQKGELGEGGYEAWILLGETRSMDEREEAGMRALTEGVRRAEEAGGKGAGMLSLAISFTNEGYERGSHSMLMRWLRARFPDFTPTPEATASLKETHWASREAVTDAFLTIARQQHAAGVVDSDVQTGLGVLFYTNGDFDRARDCFESALAAKPRDYLLWNRLGSCLSNGNKPEEALGAYREALQMRPTYTRAIYNVGVACLNIGADKEAAEHFLSALALQDSSSGEKSEQLWFTLRRALLSLGRSDLAEKARMGGDLNAFRAEGFDF